MGRYISDEGRMIGSGGEFTLKVKKDEKGELINKGLREKI